MNNSNNITDISEIIEHYDNVMRNVDKDAQNISSKGGSYGGHLRKTKGKLLEDITESLVRIAWHRLGGKYEDLEISKKKVPIFAEESYVSNLSDSLSIMKNHLLSNNPSYSYKLSVDKHIYIRNKFVMAIECKSFTEVAMLKRVCIDFSLLRASFSDLECILIQMESMLGGDYSKKVAVTEGSISGHVVLSRFPFNIEIITLLEGERKIEEPTHKKYKPLKKETLESAVDTIKNKLGKHSN